MMEVRSGGGTRRVCLGELFKRGQVVWGELQGIYHVPLDLISKHHSTTI